MGLYIDTLLVLRAINTKGSALLQCVMIDTTAPFMGRLLVFIKRKNTIHFIRPGIKSKNKIINYMCTKQNLLHKIVLGECYHV